jgi:acyl-CoA synthetase (AMP-forming)/AMP-acid ligase II
LNIARQLHAIARVYTDAPAISVGDEPLYSYRQLSARVAALAGGLHALPGMRSGERVALTMSNSPAYLELLWATWHAGLCVVPINAKLHPREFAYILRNSDARYCFASERLAGGIDTALQEDDNTSTRVIDTTSDDYKQLAAHEALTLQPVRPDDPAWLFYTSGTTGRPKGAMLTHRTLLAMSLRYYADIEQPDPADSMIHMAPLSHASGLYSIPHVFKGSQQVIPASQGFDPAELCTLLEHYRKATFFAAPTMVTRLVNHPSIGSAQTDHIDTIIYGGAPMYLENLKSAMSALGPCLMQLYGQGETPNTISWVSKALHSDTDNPRYEQRLASVGVARTGVDVRVVDDAGEDVPTGEIGEIICCSDVTMAGYWQNEEATSNALRDGWLHTGDLGTMDDDGFLTLKDRSKDVIISGGSNIYPREVEEVLLLHDDVLEVSVVGGEHPDWGEQVIAFVAPKPGRQVDSAALDELCLQNIARFKRPKRYIPITELPKNSYGKVLKTELRTQLQADSQSDD